MKKCILVTLFLHLIFSLNAQEKFTFEIKPSKESYYRFEPINLLICLKNKDTTRCLRIMHPWYSRPGVKPFLQVKNRNKWTTIPLSNYLQSFPYCGSLDLGFDVLREKEHVQVSLAYFPYFYKKDKHRRYIINSIFPRYEKYKIRLCYLNTPSWRDFNDSNLDNENISDIIYSNEIEINIIRINKVDKKAAKWLRKNQMLTSLIYYPHYNMPAHVFSPYFEKEKIEAFVEKYPNSSFTVYLKDQLNDDSMNYHWNKQAQKNKKEK